MYKIHKHDCGLLNYIINRGWLVYSDRRWSANVDHHNNTERKSCMNLSGLLLYKYTMFAIDLCVSGGMDALASRSPYFVKIYNGVSS